MEVSSVEARERQWGPRHAPVLDDLVLTLAERVHAPVALERQFLADKASPLKFLRLGLRRVPGLDLGLEGRVLTVERAGRWQWRAFRSRRGHGGKGTTRRKVSISAANQLVFNG